MKMSYLLARPRRVAVLKIPRGVLVELFGHIFVIWRDDAEVVS